MQNTHTTEQTLGGVTVSIVKSRNLRSLSMRVGHLERVKVTAAVDTRLCEFFFLNFRALSRTHFERGVWCVWCVLCVLSVSCTWCVWCVVACRLAMCRVLCAAWCFACGAVHDGCFLLSTFLFSILCCSHLVTSPNLVRMLRNQISKTAATVTLFLKLERHGVLTLIIPEPVSAAPVSKSSLSTCTPRKSPSSV